jgi:hypothetical protein
MDADEQIDGRTMLQTETTLKQRTYLLIGILLLLSAGCSNPRNILVTEENKSTLFGELRASKALAPEEDQLLTGYRVRYEMAVAINEYEIRENDLPLVGKTVGELIGLQKQWLEEQKQAEANADAGKTPPEAKAEPKAPTPELNKTVTVTVVDKGYSASSYQSGHIEDYLTYRIVYKNICDRGIRAFQGRLLFQGPSGRRMLAVGLTISRPIRAGKKAESDKTIKYNPRDDEQRMFRDTELKKMKIVWIPEKVTFTDGTTVTKE